MYLDSQSQGWDVTGRIGEWSNEHEIPVRVLMPSSRGIPNPETPWTDGQVSVATRDWGRYRSLVARRNECESSGITIYALSTSEGRPYSFAAMLDDGESELLGFRTQDPPMFPITIDRTVSRSSGNWMTNGSAVVGEMGPRVIYDWVGMNRGFLGIDDELVQAFVDALDTITDDDWAGQAAQRQLDAVIESLSEFSTRLRQTKVDQFRNGINSLEASLIHRQQAVAETIAELRQQQQLLDHLLKLDDDSVVNQIKSDYLMLRDHPRIVSAQCLNGVLTLVTSDDFRITRSDTGESRWLGQFKITVDMNAQQCEIENLTTPRMGRHHPHVNGTYACFGGHANDFAELLRTGQIYLYFELLCQYLETLNLEDEWGAYGAYWFDVPDERPLVEEVPESEVA